MGSWIITRLAARLSRSAQRGGVEEEALQLAGCRLERVEVGQRAPGELVVGVGRPDGHRAGCARLDLVRRSQHPPPGGQRCAELRRNGQPVLRVERVVEGSAEVQRRSYKVLKAQNRGWVGAEPATRVPEATPTFNIPLSPHNATQMAPVAPHSVLPPPSTTPIPRRHGRFGVGRGATEARAAVQEGVQSGVLRTALAIRAQFRPRGVLGWRGARAVVPAAREVERVRVWMYGVSPRSPAPGRARGAGSTRRAPCCDGAEISAPPCAWATSAAMARPSAAGPLPPARGSLEPRDRPRQSRPVIGDLDAHGRAVHGYLDPDRSSPVLDGVGDEIAQRLSQPQPVSPHGRLLPTPFHPGSLLPAAAAVALPRLAALSRDPAGRRRDQAATAFGRCSPRPTDRRARAPPGPVRCLIARRRTGEGSCLLRRSGEACAAAVAKGPRSS